MTDTPAPRTAAVSELRDMHERLHELSWEECEVCGLIRAAIEAEAAPDAALREAGWRGCERHDRGHGS